MANPLPKAGTEVPPAQHGAGFPPFHTETYPAQIFWLVITFAFLLVMMWRFVVPRIGSTLAERKSRIDTELAKAESDRKRAEQEAARYQTTIVEARQRARSLVEQNRAHVVADVERAEATADAQAQDAIEKAEARLSALREQAHGHVIRAAEEAAADIVNRLIGVSISPDETAAAVRSALG
jgi:F-type H+-transporting ATPase subunit b